MTLVSMGLSRRFSIVMRSSPAALSHSLVDCFIQNFSFTVNFVSKKTPSFLHLVIHQLCVNQHVNWNNFSKISNQKIVFMMQFHFFLVCGGHIIAVSYTHL